MKGIHVYDNTTDKIDMHLCSNEELKAFYTPRTSSGSNLELLSTLNWMCLDSSKLHI